MRIVRSKSRWPTRVRRLSARLWSVSTESEAAPAPGPLAPRPAAPLAQRISGGAGLFDHSERDAVGPSAGAIAGILAIAATAALAVMFVAMNPSFASGKAGGTVNQLGAVVAAGGAPVVEPGSPA